METIERLFKDLETGKPQRFSPAQIQTFTSNFSTSLGSGGFGDVYKGILSNGEHVAVKVLKGGLLSDGNDQFKMEVSALAKTHHRNLVKLWGFCFEDNMKAIVYEFMQNGSLDKLLYDNQSIEWETLCNIVIGTANGLSYLHKDCQPRIIHYDVKPSNIFLDSKNFPKVGDFGLAKLLDQDKSYAIVPRFRETSNYVAPELNMPYSSVTHKCDVYSYGVMLFDIIGRQRHLLGESQKWVPSHVWKKFDEQNDDELMKECDIQEKHREQAKRILLIALRCVQFLPDDRPSMDHVVRLLKSREVVEMPPNRFLFVGSSSSSRIDSSSSSRIDSSTPKENAKIIHNAWTKPVLIGPWGGLGGRNWDDGVYPGIKQILLFREYKQMRAIQIEYCGKDGESVWSRRHGDNGVCTVDKIELDYPSEFLTKITGYHASGYHLVQSREPGLHLISQVTSLCFFTSMKKYGPFGDESGEFFTSGKDGKVVGFHGRCGEFFHAIGLRIEYPGI